MRKNAINKQNARPSFLGAVALRAAGWACFCMVDPFQMVYMKIVPEKPCFVKPFLWIQMWIFQKSQNNAPNNALQLIKKSFPKKFFQKILQKLLTYVKNYAIICVSKGEDQKKPSTYKTRKAESHGKT